VYLSQNTKNKQLKNNQYRFSTYIRCTRIKSKTFETIELSRQAVYTITFHANKINMHTLIEETRIISHTYNMKTDNQYINK